MIGVRAFVVFLGCALSVASSWAAQSSPPNIVLIFVDDMGYSDIGPFGNDKVRTPHLDKFAAEGMKFTNFYATPVWGPICSERRGWERNPQRVFGQEVA